MKKVDNAILEETKFIAIWTLIFSMLMQAVFLVVGAWDYTVLLGNLLMAVCGILNFFFLGLTVQKATEKEDENERKSLLKFSKIFRMIFILGVGILGATLPCFNIWATVITIIFPRLAILIRTFTVNKQSAATEPVEAEQEAAEPAEAEEAAEPVEAEEATEPVEAEQEATEPVEAEQEVATNEETAEPSCENEVNTAKADNDTDSENQALREQIEALKAEVEALKAQNGENTPCPDTEGKGELCAEGKS